MALTLTPEQQAALDQFEADAQEAQDTARADTAAQSAFQLAQLEAEHARQASLNAHVAALASAQAFVALMVPNIEAAAKAAATAAAKTK